MYKLTSQTDTTRTYQNEQTGTVVTTSLKFTDADGGRWWAFDDLFAIPAIRKIASQKVAQLYGVGITVEDLRTFITTHTANLRADKLRGDDKYEKSIADVVNLQTIIEQTADPVAQVMGLCTVYVLADDERIDLFTMPAAAQKMQQWALQPDVQAFFLSWWMDGTNPYMQLLQATSPTALKAAV